MLFISGQWISPSVSGDFPPYCCYFTLTSLTDNTFLMFGGINYDEEETNTVYIGNCTQSTIVSILYYNLVSSCVGGSKEPPGI